MAGDRRTGFEVKVEGRMVAALYTRPDWYPNGMSTTMLSDVLALLQVTTPTKLNYRFVGWKYGNQILDLQTATMADVISFGGGSISAEFVVDESESSDPLDVSSYEGGNMLNSNIFRTRDVRWTSANLDMREGKAFGHRPTLEKGPCKHGFHVPTVEEREEVSDVIEELDLSEKIHEALLLPKAGKKTGLNTDVDVGDEGYYLTRIPNANGTANVFHPSAEGSEMLQMAIKNAISVRGFRNSPITPTTGWTRLPSGGARLPHEYQEVEYIESDGNAYINTGYIPKAKTEFDITFEPSAYVGTYCTIMGTRVSTSANAYRLGYYAAQDRCYVEFSPTNTDPFNISWRTLGQKYNITYHNKIISDGASSVTLNHTQDCTLPLFLFIGNNNGTAAEGSSLKLYQLKLYEDNIVVHDYVPCYRIGDGAIGLYDLIEGKFYTNAGSGAFKKGAPVNVWQMPSGYTELAYIESDGNAYVNTGILSKNINEIEMDVSDIYIGSSYADQYSYIVFGTTASSWWFSSTYYTNNGARFRYHKAITGGPHDDCNAPQTGSINHLIYTRTQFTVNGNVGTQAGTDPSWTNADEYPVCFWYCGNNSRSKYKLYSLKITTNNGTVDFVPCVRNSDGVLGLYDLVTRQFFTNSGSGDFVAGPVVFRDGFKVSSNTMLYAPMDTDLFDHSLNERSITNVGITLDTSILQDKGVGYFRGNVDYGLQFTGAEFGNNDFTISWREKTLQNSTGAGSRFSSAWDASSWCGVLVGYNHTYLYAGTGGSSRNIVNGSQIFNSTPNTRVHRVLVKEGSNWKTYRNNVLFGSASGSGSVGYNISVIGNYRPGDKNPFHGYMSDFILEKKAWTDQQREDYFNATKALYGVS